jgi:hypothetical protein
LLYALVVGIYFLMIVTSNFLAPSRMHHIFRVSLALSLIGSTALSFVAAPSALATRVPRTLRAQAAESIVSRVSRYTAEKTSSVAIVKRSPKSKSNLSAEARKVKYVKSLKDRLEEIFTSAEDVFFQSRKTSSASTIAETSLPLEFRSELAAIITSLEETTSDYSWAFDTNKNIRTIVSPALGRVITRYRRLLANIRTYTTTNINPYIVSASERSMVETDMVRVQSGVVSLLRAQLPFLRGFIGLKSLQSGSFSLVAPGIDVQFQLDESSSTISKLWYQS